VNLQTVVDLAQVVASATVIGGTFFGLVQFKEFRKQRQETIAGDLMHSFMSAEFTSALATLMRLPDGVTIEELTAAGPDTEKAAVLVETTFETMGLLVFEGIAPFQLVSKLAGGTILQMWRKLGPWVAEIRTVHSNPFDGEWFQWLAELCEQSKSSGVPAYLQYRGFVPS
jgi:hypothetical protein